MKEIIDEMIEMYTDIDFLAGHIVIVINATVVFSVLGLLHHLLK